MAPDVLYTLHDSLVCDAQQVKGQEMQARKRPQLLQLLLRLPAGT
jgi:hypothetical protein